MKTYDRLVANVNRAQYGKPSVTDRQASFGAQLGMMWLYFRWQWIRDAHGDLPVAPIFAALLFLGIGAYGMTMHWRV